MLGSRRQALVGAVAAVLLTGILLVVTRFAGPPAFVALLVLVAVLAGVVVASYVPATGTSWRAQLGCSPCAVGAGAAGLVAVLLLAASPADIGMGMLAAAIAGAGVAQRARTAGEACPVPRG